MKQFISTKKIYTYILFALMSVITLASVPVATALAVTTDSSTGTSSEAACEAAREDYSRQNIANLTPPACSSLECSANATTAVVDSVKLDASDPTLKQIFTLLVNSGQFNAVQASAIMGNMYAESGFNSGAEESNSIGYGLVQWSFGRRTSLEAAAASQGVAASDIPFQISYLVGEYTSSYKSRLASTAFATGTDVSAATEAWMNVFEVPYNTPPSADHPKLQTKRIPAAVQIYGFFKDIAPLNASAATSSATPTTGSSDCSTTNAIIAGNIVQTAINLALPQPVADGKIDKSDASKAYQTAHDQYNPTVQFSDCGGFIATVMISSGVDTDYPKVNVDAQAKYVEANTDKYKVIENPKMADLQPGDILISTQAGHTTMYLGDNDSGYPAADASLGQRVPSLRDISNTKWMLDNGAIIARFIGTN